MLGIDEAVTRRSKVELPLVGRDREVAVLEGARDDVLAGEGRVVSIVAEGGRGKSRLLAEMAHDLDTAGATVVEGAADAFGRNRNYLIWRAASRDLFGLDVEAPEAEQIATVERLLDLVEPGFGQRAPLLAPVIGIDIADNDLTASFDAKLRKTSLEALLADALRARAALGPVAVFLDDAQWIDDLSIDLLHVLIRASTDLPVLIAIAYRPTESTAEELGLERHAHFQRIELPPLDDADAALVVTAKVTDLWGPGVLVDSAVATFAVERAQGNPFYLESIVEWIRSRGLDPGNPARSTASNCPTTCTALS